MKTALILQLASTLFMVGLIWFVQVVHYPLFASVPAHASAAYERAHTERTSWVVVLPMVLELASALWLAALPGEHRTVRMAGAALVGVVWASTFFLQVPMHNRLASGFDESAHARLVLTNWIRTVAWSARGVLVLWLAHKAMR